MRRKEDIMMHALEVNLKRAQETNVIMAKREFKEKQAEKKLKEDAETKKMLIQERDQLKKMKIQQNKNFIKEQERQRQLELEIKHYPDQVSPDDKKRLEW